MPRQLDDRGWEGVFFGEKMKKAFSWAAALVSFLFSTSPFLAEEFPDALGTPVSNLLREGFSLQEESALQGIISTGLDVAILGH